MPTLTGFLLVFIGSGLGGMARHGVGLFAVRHGGVAFPWGTMLVNIVGAALMGLVVVWFVVRASGSAELRLFLATGVLGGFTTWSSFSIDAYTLWQRGDTLAAAGYVGGSFVLSIAAIAAVLAAARHWA